MSVAGGTGITPAELIVSRGQTEASISHNDYAAQLHVLQIELVKLQRHFIGCGDRILVLLEGRDAAGTKTWQGY
ncbi:polyphosphate kinase 2 family protein [Pseudomonas sp. Ant30-3]